MASDSRPRLCHIIKWPDFDGYGFNLHAERGKAGQYIGKVDEGSPSEKAGLKEGDRIVEINGTNIGNENHQQVVSRIKAGGDQVKLLVVDPECDKFYKDNKQVVRGDLPEVVKLNSNRDEPRPSSEESSPPEPQVEEQSIPAENNIEEVTATVGAVTVEEVPSQFCPRLCHIKKWPDFQGYGFNLHAERDRPGQYIGKIDDDSPAEAAGLKEGDRIIEINGANIENETHQQVIARVKAGGNETKMLVLDKEADEYYKNKGVQVSLNLAEVIYRVTPDREAPVDNGPVEPVSVPVVNNYPEADNSQYYPRCCHVIKWPDFQGYGFNLHAEKDKPGQFIGKIDDNSPAEAAGLQMGDRIIEVNDVNIETETHPQVIGRVKAGGDETKLLVVDKETDQYYQRKGVKITANLPEVKFITTPRRGAVNGQASTAPTPTEPVKYNEPVAPKMSSSVPAPEPAANGDLNLNLTAAEMRARLSQRKGGKHDVKAKGLDFKSKYDMFQRM